MLRYGLLAYSQHASGKSDVQVELEQRALLSEELQRASDLRRCEVGGESGRKKNDVKK